MDLVPAAPPSLGLTVCAVHAWLCPLAPSQAGPPSSWGRAPPLPQPLQCQSCPLQSGSHTGAAGVLVNDNWELVSFWPERPRSPSGLRAQGWSSSACAWGPARLHAVCRSAAVASPCPRRSSPARAQPRGSRPSFGPRITTLGVTWAVPVKIQVRLWYHSAAPHEKFI